jgi:hypothetical protein
MNVLKKIILILFILSFTFIYAKNKKTNFVQKLAHGEIHWTEHFVYATGSGAPSLKAPNVAVARLGAERTAKLDAMRNLLETIKGLKISASTTMQNSMETEMSIKTEISGKIRKMEIVSTKYYSDGAVDVVVRIPISSVFSAISPTALVKAPKIDTKEQFSGEKNTVLIIDVRGKTFTPLIFPVFYTENGKVFYSAKFVDKDVLMKDGMVQYGRLSPKIVANNIFGKNITPVIVKAKVKKQEDIILPQKALKTISSKISAETLKNGRVIIIF